MAADAKRLLVLIFLVHVLTKVDIEAKNSLLVCNKLQFLSYVIVWLIEFIKTLTLGWNRCDITFGIIIRVVVDRTSSNIISFQYLLFQS